VHLVDFTIEIYVTVHGPMNVKKGVTFMNDNSN